MTFTLPWPPSVNHLFYTHGGRRHLSAKGRQYHKDASALVLASKDRPRSPIAGPLGLEIRAFPPDRRRRDLSNLVKVVEDSLTIAGVWEDDSQVDDLRVVREGVCAGGKVVVTVWALA